ncbi:MAG TPA: ATP-grasp domain-containing protein [Mycobacteriales bacterium]|nr:ATP-grasp domain-containing protein [Mycobacteriales bacterium]
MSTPEPQFRPARPRVLITGAGGPAAVAAMLDLPDAVEWVAADIDPHAVGLYLVPPQRRLLVPRGDDPELVDRLLEAAARHQVDVVWPTVDSELEPVAEASDRFAAIGVRVLSAPVPALAVCLDKWLLIQRCRDVVRVPATQLLTADTDLAAVPMPYVLKPRRGAGGRGVRVVRSAADTAGVPRDGSYLCQEYLPGEEFSIDVLCRPDGTVAAAVPRRRDKVDSGIAVAGRTVADPGLETFGRVVATRVGLLGVSNVQVRRDRQGRPALLEVNPRLPGTMPLTIAAGVDMPAWALAAVLGGTIPTGLSYREVAVVRHWTERVVPVSEVDDVIVSRAAAAAAGPA